MGKSFSKDKNNYSEKRNQYNDYKRRKNQEREDHYHEEFSEYKIHGFKKEKAPK